MNITNTLYKGCAKSQNYWFRLDKINVKKCICFPDCTYVETVDLSFIPCNKDGSISGEFIDARFRVVFEIETGYLSEKNVVTELKNGLAKFNILDIDNLIAAFKYRKYYCSF